MIRFGSWSTALAFGAIFGLTVAALLWGTRHNREANRCLAGLMVVIVLKLVPYMLGFAGYYDAFPWLSFAPFGLGLAIGPLLYLHVWRLGSSRLPHRWALHFIPVAAEFVYGCALFAQPLEFKNAWDKRVQVPWIDPVETTLILVSVVTYLAFATLRYREYQRWLEAHVSNRDAFRLDWIRNFLIALGLLLVFWIPYEFASAVGHFNYFQRFPLYVGVMILVIYLGLEGWRHAGLRYPVETAPDRIPDSEQGVAGRNWNDQGVRWLDQLEKAGWWRDPELSLDQLARHIGTNASYLSKALNEGLSMSFSDAVNGLRVASVQAALENPGERRDILAVALDAGFSSKASFNRIFKARTGLSPTQYRARHVATRLKS